MASKRRECEGEALERASAPTLEPANPHTAQEVDGGSVRSPVSVYVRHSVPVRGRSKLWQFGDLVTPVPQWQCLCSKCHIANSLKVKHSRRVAVFGILKWPVIVCVSLFVVCGLLVWNSPDLFFVYVRKFNKNKNKKLTSTWSSERTNRSLRHTYSDFQYYIIV